MSYDVTQVHLNSAYIIHKVDEEEENVVSDIRQSALSSPQQALCISAIHSAFANFKAQMRFFTLDHWENKDAMTMFLISLDDKLQSLIKEVGLEQLERFAQIDTAHTQSNALENLITSTKVDFSKIGMEHVTADVSTRQRRRDDNEEESPLGRDFVGGAVGHQVERRLGRVGGMFTETAVNAALDDEMPEDSKNPVRDRIVSAVAHTAIVETVGLGLATASLSAPPAYLLIGGSVLVGSLAKDLESQTAEMKKQFSEETCSTKGFVKRQMCRYLGQNVDNVALIARAAQWPAKGIHWLHDRITHEGTEALNNAGLTDTAVSHFFTPQNPVNAEAEQIRQTSSVCSVCPVAPTLWDGVEKVGPFKMVCDPKNGSVQFTIENREIHHPPSLGVSEK